ncbi:MAG: polyprenyl synthetase family protein [Phycisphaerales bacterium]|nr:MAG: polyprenyl synthetase family protein [Phycisphaerales bacterium]
MQLPAHRDISGQSAEGAPPVFRPVEHHLDEVRELIAQQLNATATDGDIQGLLEHVSFQSGKMIRPGLLLLASACCGKITDKHIRVAAIVEMIHNATLLHDDVIDEGQKRRGRPTINSLRGNELAVLVGDFLLSRVFRMCSELEPQAAKVIAEATIRVCEGELRQVVQRRNWRLSEPEYIDIITDKSAALFSSCCRLGALLSQADKLQVRLLAEFGLNAGIAFQITDDLLDIVGDEGETGKTLGSDADKNKPTLATIHLLRNAGAEQREIIEGWLADPVNSRARLLDMLDSHGSLEYSRRRAREYAAGAIESLSRLAESDARDALVETAHFILRRAG